MLSKGNLLDDDWPGYCVGSGMYSDGQCIDLTRTDSRWWSCELSVCQREKLRTSYSGSPGHLGGRRPFVVTRLPITADLIRPYAAMGYCRFQCHGFQFFLPCAVGPRNCGHFTLSALMHETTAEPVVCCRETFSTPQLLEWDYYSRWPVTIKKEWNAFGCEKPRLKNSTSHSQK